MYGTILVWRDFNWLGIGTSNVFTRSLKLTFGQKEGRALLYQPHDCQLHIRTALNVVN